LNWLDTNSFLGAQGQLQPGGKPKCNQSHKLGWMVPRDHHGNNTGFEKQGSVGYTGVVERLVIFRPRAFGSLPKAQQAKQRLFQTVKIAHYYYHPHVPFSHGNQAAQLAVFIRDTKHASAMG